MSKLKVTPPHRKIGVTSKSPVGDISVVTLIRTDTTLDHSQKAEKVWLILPDLDASFDKTFLVPKLPDFAFLWVSEGVLGVFPKVFPGLFFWRSSGFPGDFPGVFLWCPLGFPEVFLWFSWGAPSGFPLVFLGFFAKVFLGFFFGFSEGFS